MATISYLTTVQFDYGAIKLAGAECKRLGITLPLIVTDRGIRTAGLLERLRENLAAGASFEVYEDGIHTINRTEFTGLTGFSRINRIEP